MTRPKPLFLSALLSDLDEELIHYLNSLEPQDWKAQTTAPLWQVRDVAAHLLDGNLRSLSMLRDGYFGEQAENADTYAGLVGFLNRLNADWVKAMRRLSPRVLCDLLEESGREYCEWIAKLDNYAPAAFSVAWAGEESSQNWFHIAREYTEKWHHQQQIRFATGDPDTLLSDQWYLPYLDTSVRALPWHYRNTPGERGDLIRIAFRGETDKVWYLQWEAKGWQLHIDADEEPTAEVIVPDAIAWRVLTKGISWKDALEASTLTGKSELAAHFFALVAVMA